MNFFFACLYTMLMCLPLKDRPLFRQTHVLIHACWYCPSENVVQIPHTHCPGHWCESVHPGAWQLESKCKLYEYGSYNIFFGIICYFQLISNDLYLFVTECCHFYDQRPVFVHNLKKWSVLSHCKLLRLCFLKMTSHCQGTKTVVTWNIVVGVCN